MRITLHPGAEQDIADDAGLLVDIDLLAEARQHAAVRPDHGCGTIVCRPPGASCWRGALSLVTRLTKSLT